MKKKKRYLPRMKASSMGLYILLSLTMFKDIEERLVNKLEITTFWGMLIAGIGLGIPVIMYMVRLRGEKSKESLSNIHMGCMVLLTLIIINLMDAKVVSMLFYFLIRFTIGWIYQYLYASIFVSTWGLFWKIAIGIILIVILLAIYFAIMYSIANPLWPLVGFIVAVLEVMGESAGESSKQTVQANDSGSTGIVETIVAGMVVNDAIKREVERQEMIRRDPMSEFRP